MSTELSSKYTSPNSFYQYGDIDILTFMQDEESLLWKFYLSTPEHYVVSREFDKSHGIYANAPEEIIRRGLMDFSASVIGEKDSIFAIMDLFIDRCFDDSVFDEFTTNAVWMCIDNPSYEEIEDITMNYSTRIIWSRDQLDENYPILGEYMNRILYKTPNPGGEREILIKNLLKEFKNAKISSIFLNNDRVIEDVLSDPLFDGIPIFIGEFTDKNSETFKSFKYIGH